MGASEAAPKRREVLIATQHPPVSDLPQAAATILVVEDEDLLRRLLARVLEEAGYAVLEACHGGEALQLMTSDPPSVDLVITDVVMPHLDGRELGRRLAKQWPRLPVIYMSAYEAADVFQRGAPSPSATFVRKPFATDLLVAKVREALEHGPGESVS